MRRSMSRGAALLAVMAAGACVSAHYVPTADAVYPPRADDCELEIYMTGVPDRPYFEIGIVEGEGDLWKADMGDLLPELKAEACRAGGDAIVLGDADKYAEGRDGTPVLHATAVVIRWVR